jgi:hypothetical protein
MTSIAKQLLRCTQPLRIPYVVAIPLKSLPNPVEISTLVNDSTTVVYRKERRKKVSYVRPGVNKLGSN